MNIVGNDIRNMIDSDIKGFIEGIVNDNINKLYEELFENARQLGEQNKDRTDYNQMVQNQFPEGLPNNEEVEEELDM